MKLMGECFQVLQIAEDEGGQHEVGCGVLNGQCDTASEAECRCRSELDGGALKHLG